MAVKSAVLIMIFENSGSIGATFGCAAVVARSTIVISVVIVATIFLVITRYDIGSAVVIIILIGNMMLDIMVMVITIVVGDHRPCCLTCLGR